MCRRCETSTNSLPPQPHRHRTNRQTIQMQGERTGAPAPGAPIYADTMRGQDNSPPPPGRQPTPRLHPPTSFHSDGERIIDGPLPRELTRVARVVRHVSACTHQKSHVSHARPCARSRREARVDSTRAYVQFFQFVLLLGVTSSSVR